MDLTGDSHNPYLGIFSYVVAPAFLILGLGLIFFGAWAQRRWALKHTAMPDKWRLDFSNPQQKRLLIVFGCGAVGFLLLSAFGSYQTFHYSESVQFCGQVCHEAMNPEFTTYQRGAHARVDCVACHVGSGAAAFIKAKINGTHQLIAYTLDNYQRPIPAPVENLRPARETCAKCHWPEKFLGNLDITYDHYLSKKSNNPYSVRMLMHVNTGRPGHPFGGIHWHVREDTKVEYYATDKQRQKIAWMRVTNRTDGTSKVFRQDGFIEEPPSAEIREMDCVDCHNRPAHVFKPINESIEQAMSQGKISMDLPRVKRVVAQALVQNEIKTSEAAPGLIADFLKSKYPDAKNLEGTIAEAQRIYAESIFPERQADWRIYPNNIGHKDWLGCFRCHDDKHKTKTGETVRASDCKSCHTILAQGSGEDMSMLSAGGLDFDHPGGEYDAELTCSDCHNGGIQGK